ncbi:hypothetical protein [Thiobacillus denitrificans]|uniref:Uncharacterized protein n=1 Tax=Thiobacillus denitrificans TaxID=36861 RepID=A0A106BSU7_THIDE|nr:hypothetical protein [Thiobacillus denitrificans]KVW98001.1 hypothetical protein ABW22_02975 [Thiobacillus denitrificans]
MSQHSAASAMELDVGTTVDPWYLVELAEPREGGRWRADASIRAIVLDAAAGKLGPHLYITAVLAAECEPQSRSEFLRVKSIYRLADTLYLARTVEQSLLLDDGQTVQLIHPWGSS